MQRWLNLEKSKMKLRIKNNAWKQLMWTNIWELKNLMKTKACKQQGFSSLCQQDSHLMHRTVRLGQHIRTFSSNNKINQQGGTQLSRRLWNLLNDLMRSQLALNGSHQWIWVQHCNQVEYRSQGTHQIMCKLKDQAFSPKLVIEAQKRELLNHWLSGSGEVPCLSLQQALDYHFWTVYTNLK